MLWPWEKNPGKAAKKKWEKQQEEKKAEEFLKELWKKTEVGHCWVEGFDVK